MTTETPAHTRVREAMNAAADAHRRAAVGLVGDVVTGSRALQRALADGGKVLVCGNGGSAAESQHFAAELTGRFRRERPALAALALSADTSALTAIGNDYGFDRIFARQVEALGQRGDVLVAISTSGESPNIVEAARAARSRGMTVLALTGTGAGALGAQSDVVLAVQEPEPAHVQEVHLTVLHVLCDEIERAVAGEP